MNKTYQPFIIQKSEEILEILKDDIKPLDHNKEQLCLLLTNKFINGTLSADDDVSTIFDSEDELLKFINECDTYEHLVSLMEKGLIDMIEDENNEELFFLTDAGKLQVQLMKKQ